MSSVIKTTGGTHNRPLDPRIVDTLGRFLRRANFTDALRGICLLVVTFLIGFGLVAAIDYFWFMEDLWRLVFSALAYVVTLLVFIFAVIRPSRRKESLDALAGKFERAEPKLRNHLLSAVELGDGQWDDESSSAGSPQLRQLLQRRVANFIAGIKVSKLIPIKVIQPWLNIALALTAIVLLGMFLPGSPVALLYARAVAPLANLARASTTKITILKPNLDLGFVPANETLMFEAMIEGLGQRDAWLEVRDAQQVKQSLVMRASEQDSEALYHCNFDIGEEPIEFRIYAGDALTAWSLIEPKLRPETERVEYTIDYPEYAKMEPTIVDSEIQAITILFGSEVTLAADLNQPISGADLEFVNGTGPSRGVAGEMGQAGRAMERPQLNKVTYPFGRVYDRLQYQMHFRASDTNFESVFPDTYTIEVIEDQPPTARLSLSGLNSMTVVSRDLLPMNAEVRDELAVDMMRLEYAINEDTWTAFPENIDIALEATESAVQDFRMVYAAQSEVDLANVSLREGDSIRFRMAATDRKEQTSYSNEVEVLVTADYFTDQRYTYVEQKLVWLQKVLEWSDVEQRQTTADDVLQVTKELISKTEPGTETLELEWIGRAILTLEQTAISRPGRNDNERKRVRNAAEWFAAQAVNHVVAEDIRALHATTERIVSLAPQNSDAWNKRQLEILATNYKSCLGQYERFIEFLPDSTKRSLRSVREQLQQYEERIDGIVQDEVDRRRIMDEQSFQHQQLVYRKDNPLLDGGMIGNAMDGLRASYQLRFSHGMLIEKMAQVLTEQSELKKKQAKLEDAEQAGDLQAKLQEKNELFKRTVEELDGQLTMLHGLHQSRQDVNPQRINDLDLVQKVVSAVLSSKVSGVEPGAAFAEIAKATSVLDTGQDVFELGSLLRLLTLDERWNGDSLDLRLENPRRWDYWGRGIELVIGSLRTSPEFAGELTGAFDQLRYADPAGNVGRTIGNRRWDKNWSTTAADNLDVILANYVQRQESVEDVMETARETLRKYLPNSEEKRQSKEDQKQSTEPQSESEAEQPDFKQLANLPDVELSELLEAAEAMNAEEMLKALEEELKSNPPMQQELSEIADQIVDQAMEQLERAAQDEYESQRSLEQSDAAVREEREMALRQLQDLAQQIDQLRSNVAQQARSVAGRAAAKEAIDKLSEADELLSQASQEARKANGSMLSEEIAGQAEKSSQLLDEAKEKLEAGKAAAESVKQQELENEPNRQRTRDQMKALQNTTKDNLARAAEQRERQWQQLERNLENQAKNSERQAKSAENNLEKAKQNAAKNPENDGLKQAVAEAERAVQRAKAEQSAFEQMQKRAEELAKEAGEQKKQIKASQAKPLEANNPAAELAEEMSRQAAEMTEALSQTGQQIRENLDNRPGIQADRNQFAATANQQAQIQQQVNQVAESLERAGRHEQRLGNEEASERLQQAAESVRQTAESAIESAKQSAEKAHDGLAESNQRASDAKQGRETASALAEARQAIADQLQQLSAVAEAGQSEQSDQPEQSGRTDQIKARALDDLDRAIQAAAQQAQAQSQTQAQAQAQSQPNALSQSPTLAQAAAEQASAAAQQASQAEGDAQEASASSQQTEGAMSPGGTMDGQASAKPFGGDEAESPILQSMEDWGELRERRAEESAEGKRSAIPRRYQKQIEAYFRSISEKVNP